ncbi:MAG: hypothetical protein V7709_14705 [Halioglobus sp.]
MGFGLSRARVMYSLSFFTLLFLSCSIFHSTGSHANTGPALPVAEKGLLDLCDWSFERDGSLSLAGEWQFFWQQLIAPGDIATGQYSYQMVPALWTTYADDLPVSGYATYRLKVLLPPEHGSIALANDASHIF